MPNCTCLVFRDSCTFVTVQKFYLLSNPPMTENESCDDETIDLAQTPDARVENTLPLRSAKTTVDIRDNVHAQVAAQTPVVSVGAQPSGGHGWGGFASARPVSGNFKGFGE